jgi:hypothetical protein
MMASKSSGCGCGDVKNARRRTVTSMSIQAKVGYNCYDETKKKTK